MKNSYCCFPAALVVCSVFFSVCLAGSAHAEAEPAVPAVPGGLTIIEDAEMPSPFPGLEESTAPGAADPEELFRLAGEAVLSEPDRAVELYRAGLASEPENRMARRALADLLRDEGQFSEAADHYRLLWLEEPEEEVALRLAESYRSAGHFLSAALIAEDGFAKFPGQPRLAAIAAASFEALGMAEKALEWLEISSFAAVPGPEERLRRAALAERAGNPAAAARDWAGLLGGEHDEQARGALARLSGEALAIGELLVFPAPGWLVVFDGFLEPASGRQVTVAAGARADGADLVEAFLLEGFYLPDMEALENFLPEKWSGFAAGGVAGADGAQELTAEQEAALAAALPPAPLRLERLPAGNLPGTLAILVMAEENPLLPVSPQARMAWAGALAGRAVVVGESGPPDLPPERFLEFCLSLAENTVAVPLEAR